MTEILTRAASLICMVALAFTLKKIHILKKEDFRVVSALVVKITLPCAIIINFSRMDFDVSLFFLVPIGFCGTLFLIGIGYFMARKKSPNEKAFQMINHSGFNIGTFAIPYLHSFVGPSGVIAASMFDIGNALLCTGGTYALASSVQDPHNRPTIGSLLKKTFSSIPTLTYLLMTLLSLLHLRLPKGILTFTEIGADANAFLAMAMLGIGMELTLNRRHFSAITRILSVRYLAAMAFSLAAWFLLPFDRTLRKTLVILLFSPLASFDPIFTEKCGGDVGLSSEINSISIIISIICMTLLLIIL